jgi:hypothetical protein
MNGSCIGVPGTVPVACGPRPNDDKKPSISVVTRFGAAAADGAAVTAATTVGFDGTNGVADVSVADVDVVDGGLCSGVAGDVFGANSSCVTEIDPCVAASALEMVGG